MHLGSRADLESGVSRFDPATGVDSVINWTWRLLRGMGGVTTTHGDFLVLGSGPNVTEGVVGGGTWPVDGAVKLLALGGADDGAGAVLFGFVHVTRGILSRPWEVQRTGVKACSLTSSYPYSGYFASDKVSALHNFIATHTWSLHC